MSKTIKITKTIFAGAIVCSILTGCGPHSTEHKKQNHRAHNRMIMLQVRQKDAESQLKVAKRGDNKGANKSVPKKVVFVSARCR